MPDPQQRSATAQEPVRHVIGEMSVDFTIPEAGGAMEAPEHILQQIRQHLLPELDRLLQEPRAQGIDVKADAIELDLGAWPADPDWDAVRAAFRDGFWSAIAPYIQTRRKADQITPDVNGNAADATGSDPKIPAVYTAGAPLRQKVSRDNETGAHTTDADEEKPDLETHQDAGETQVTQNEAPASEETDDLIVHAVLEQVVQELKRRLRPALSASEFAQVTQTFAALTQSLAATLLDMSRAGQSLRGKIPAVVPDISRSVPREASEILGLVLFGQSSDAMATDDPLPHALWRIASDAMVATKDMLPDFAGLQSADLPTRISAAAYVATRRSFAIHLTKGAHASERRMGPAAPKTGRTKHLPVQAAYSAPRDGDIHKLVSTIMPIFRAAGHDADDIRAFTRLLEKTDSLLKGEGLAKERRLAKVDVMRARIEHTDGVAHPKSATDRLPVAEKPDIRNEQTARQLGDDPARADLVRDTTSAGPREPETQQLHQSEPPDQEAKKQQDRRFEPVSETKEKAADLADESLASARGSSDASTRHDKETQLKARSVLPASEGGEETDLQSETDRKRPPQVEKEGEDQRAAIDGVETGKIGPAPRDSTPQNAAPFSEQNDPAEVARTRADDESEPPSAELTGDVDPMATGRPAAAHRQHSEAQPVSGTARSGVEEVANTFLDVMHSIPDAARQNWRMVLDTVWAAIPQGFFAVENSDLQPDLPAATALEGGARADEAAIPSIDVGPNLDESRQSSGRKQAGNSGSASDAKASGPSDPPQMSAPEIGEADPQRKLHADKPDAFYPHEAADGTRRQAAVDGASNIAGRSGDTGSEKPAKQSLDKQKTTDPAYLLALARTLIDQTGTDESLENRLETLFADLIPDFARRTAFYRQLAARLSYADGRSAPALRRRAQAAVSELLTRHQNDAGDAPVSRVSTADVSSERAYLTQSAGLVIFAPYLGMLFDRLGLLDQKRSLKPARLAEARRALQLLADETSDEAVPTDPLIKLLLGQEQRWQYDGKPADPPPDAAVIDSLLQSVISRWNALGSTSSRGLREAFIRRGGSLQMSQDGWVLIVDPAPYDMLLDKLPWAFSPISQVWMALPLHVNWRSRND